MADSTQHHAWNPGITSTIPPRLLPQITLYRPENALSDYQSVADAARASGLPLPRLALLTIDRLIIHELLVRVTADLSVPDGPNYADLGISLRGMVDTIYQNHLRPKINAPGNTPGNTAGGFAQQYDTLLAETKQTLSTILASTDTSQPQSKKRGWFGRHKKPATPDPSHDYTRLDHWRAQKTHPETDALHSACYAALAETGGAIMAQHGRLVADATLLSGLALPLVIASYGTKWVRRLIADDFALAVKAEGYRLLPAQAKPIVMNTKGASAAGKSTLRPKQRQLAERLHCQWQDFALISPDYWRKYLLDYDSLGDDYKYAAMLTGHELTLIDRKLDDYMAEKAQAGNMSHLLIDRFRFDSFNPDAEGAYQSTLLTRFGETIFLFFVITSPAATVERAWLRGLTTQRYKAVDDLLYHNIEAFAGMADLFFSWVKVADKEVHFEFIDNDQPPDRPPRTIAFGCNKTMVVLDREGLANIDRFRCVNVNATKPREVLITPSPTKQGEGDFMKRCVATLDEVHFIDDAGGAGKPATTLAKHWAKYCDAMRPLTLGDWGGR